jgi:choline kinase
MFILLTSFVRDAVILAAGNGDRFRTESGHSKLLTPVMGTPLLIRTLRSAREAGITRAHVVLGYDAGSVKALAEAAAPADLSLHFHHNPEWHQENGLSVLAARTCFGDRPFALMMGDHIFEARVLRHLLGIRRRRDEALLAIDRQAHDADTAAEATKVRIVDGRVVAIDKTLHPYDALDTGLFVCQPSLFPALDAARADGDSTLSGGIRRLAARGLVRGIDVGDARWCDVDTLADLSVAEGLLGLAPGV